MAWMLSIFNNMQMPNSFYSNAINSLSHMNFSWKSTISHDVWTTASVLHQKCVDITGTHNIQTVQPKAKYCEGFEREDVFASCMTRPGPLEMSCNDCMAHPGPLEMCFGERGIAQWLERWSRDRKVAGSNPCWSGRRIFFSRVNFLCWFLFRYPFQPCVTAVARKRPRSLCQKCRWQVTAKHAYTLRMWLCMKWYGAWLYSVTLSITSYWNFKMALIAAHLNAEVILVVTV